MSWKDENLSKVIKENGVVVMPTDTLYGIVGRAENPEVVNRIYEVRKRAPSKPCIILIGDIGELEKFSVVLSGEQKRVMKDYWSLELTHGKPDPVSIVLDCLDKKFEYLHRGTNTLAFRLPGVKDLREFLHQVGPLVAPSANLEGMPPAKTIKEAQEYFGTSVDLYVSYDGEKDNIEKKASKVIKINNDGSVLVLRP